MSTSINHLFAKLDTSLSHSSIFQKRNRETKYDLISLSKYDYQSPLNSTTRYIQSIYHTNTNSNTNRQHKNINQTLIKHKETEADIKYSFLKNELMASQDKFKSEIKKMVQSLISKKEITDREIDHKLTSLNEEINALKELIFQLSKDSLDSLDQLVNVTVNKDKSCFAKRIFSRNDNKTEERCRGRRNEEDSTSLIMYNDTCKSQASLFTNEKDNNDTKISKMNYRINKNNQNIKTLNQNIKAIMGHIKLNTSSIEELKTITIGLSKIKEENNSKLNNALTEVNNLKHQYCILNQTISPLSSNLERTKSALANGLESLDSFHLEQNKLNDIYAKTIQEMYNAFRQEKIENEKNNQLIESNFNKINPLIDKIKQIPDLEQDKYLFSELRKSKKENEHFCWSQLNKFEDLSQLQENIDNKGMNKEKSKMETTQTDLNTRITFMEDSVVTASPIIHYQSLPLLEDNLNIRDKEQNRYLFYVKYYLTGYISNNNFISKSNDCCVTLGNQSEEFNLDKTSKKMKNKKTVSVRNTIDICSNTKFEQIKEETKRMIRKKNIVDIIKKEVMFKSNKVIEIKDTHIN